MSFSASPWQCARSVKDAVALGMAVTGDSPLISVCAFPGVGPYSVTVLSDYVVDYSGGYGAVRHSYVGSCYGVPATTYYYSAPSCQLVDYPDMLQFGWLVGAALVVVAALEFVRKSALPPSGTGVSAETPDED